MILSYHFRNNYIKTLSSIITIQSIYRRKKAIKLVEKIRCAKIDVCTQTNIDMIQSIKRLELLIFEKEQVNRELITKLGRVLMENTYLKSKL